jgi:hypothetical protein
MVRLTAFKVTGAAHRLQNDNMVRLTALKRKQQLTCCRLSHAADSLQAVVVVMCSTICKINIPTAPSVGFVANRRHPGGSGEHRGRGDHPYLREEKVLPPYFKMPALSGVVRLTASKRA